MRLAAQVLPQLVLPVGLTLLLALAGVAVRRRWLVLLALALLRVASSDLTARALWRAVEAGPGGALGPGAPPAGARGRPSSRDRRRGRRRNRDRAAGDDRAGGGPGGVVRLPDGAWCAFGGHGETRGPAGRRPRGPGAHQPRRGRAGRRTPPDEPPRPSRHES